MYYTGIHPMTGKNVYVTTDYHEKKLQRALLQFSRPENANLVREALKLAGREDLIGNSPECLVRPAFAGGAGAGQYVKRTNGGKPSKKGKSSYGGGADGTSRNKPKNQRSKSKKSDKFYQPILDSRAPKLSKLERVFGDEARKIRIEAGRMTDASVKKKSTKKPNGAQAQYGKHKNGKK